MARGNAQVPRRGRARPPLVRALGALVKMTRDVGVRHVLPAVCVPTLVLDSRDDPVVPGAAGRHIAERTPGAKVVELPGRDHLPWIGDTELAIAEMRELLTGGRHEVEIDRVLATILFVDIVGSTARAAALGDTRWRTLLDAFYGAARSEIHRFRGHQTKTTGDGLLATFDGPARAIRCADAIRQASRALGLDVRAGLHTGECEVRGDDVRGIAVHICARVADQAAGGEILVSSTVRDLRSEERRVGKECRSRWAPCHQKKNNNKGTHTQ